MVLGHFSNCVLEYLHISCSVSCWGSLRILCAFLEQLCFIFLEVFWACLLHGLSVFLLCLGAITGLQLPLLYSCLCSSSDVMNGQLSELCLTWICWLLIQFHSCSDKRQTCQGWDWAPDKSHGMIRFSMHRFVLLFKISYRSCLVSWFSRRAQISHTSCMGR